MGNIKKKIYESAIFSIIVTLFLSEIVSAIVIELITAICNVFLPKTDFWEFSLMYGSFIGYWIVFIATMLIVKRDRPFLQKLGKNSGNTLKLTLIGALLGFLTNGFSILMSVLTGQIFLSLNHGVSVIQLIFIFFCVLIQSGAEELFCRLFLYQRIKLKYPSGIPSAIICALLFAALHLANPGISPLAVVDLAVSGLVFAALIYYYDAFWSAALYHTLWNYTQSIIFGLPNSGIVSIFSIFKLDATADADNLNTFIYNADFGVEGTWLSVIVQIIVLAGIMYFGEKKKKKELTSETVNAGQQEALNEEN